MIVPASTNQEKSALVTYLSGKIGLAPVDLVGCSPFEIVGVVRGGDLMGAVLYTRWREKSIEMACAGEPGWLTPAALKDLFAYPFQRLGAYTVLSIVVRRNDRARKFNERLGFKHLGVIESGASKGEDSIIYSMTRPQCRWLEERIH
ncbi:MAG: GNAT family N-acetyltransferase [Rhizobiaceae bacterium]|nr:GNAT family N-acetyltransferase [Rhizobiaceae bacterium]